MPFPVREIFTIIFFFANFRPIFFKLVVRVKIFTRSAVDFFQIFQTFSKTLKWNLRTLSGLLNSILELKSEKKK